MSKSTPTMLEIVRQTKIGFANQTNSNQSSGSHESDEKLPFHLTSVADGDGDGLQTKGSKSTDGPSQGKNRLQDFPTIPIEQFSQLEREAHCLKCGLALVKEYQKRNGLESLPISEIEPIPFVVFIVQQQEIVTPDLWEHLQTYALFVAEKLKDLYRDDAFEFLMLTQYEESEDSIWEDLV